MNWLRAHLQDAIDPLIDGDIYLVVLVILFDYNHWYLGVIGCTMKYSHAARHCQAYYNLAKPFQVPSIWNAASSAEGSTLRDSIAQEMWVQYQQHGHGD